MIKFIFPKDLENQRFTFANIDKITSISKWRPKIKIEEGISNLLKNINYWKDAPVGHPHNR